MKLIFVHGRAQEGKDKDKLRQLWIDTFKLGLKKSSLTLPIPEGDIIFPFYGDDLDKIIKQLDQPIEGIVKKGGGASNKDAAFFHDLLMEIADNAEITIPEIQANSDDVVGEKGPLNWSWVQAILRSIDKKKGWGELAIKKFTYDVFLYLTMQGVKDAVNKIVVKPIPNEPCVVVGHSLGTIVTYNILRDNPTLQVAKYITLGSPLGLAAVKKYLKTPIIMPECVKNGWYNAFDDRDVVALNPLNKKYFDIDPAIENKKDVDNHTDNRHGIEGYLNDAEVAKQIYIALTT